jgi:hypothetical protein
MGRRIMEVQMNMGDKNNYAFHEDPVKRQLAGPSNKRTKL